MVEPPVCRPRILARGKVFDRSPDLVTDFPRARQLLFMRAAERRRVREAPCTTVADARKDRTALGSLVAHRDDESEQLAALHDVPHCLALLVRQVDPHFSHDLDDEGIDRAGLETGASRLEVGRTNLIQERLGHLAACAVVNADEEHPFAHRDSYDPFSSKYNAGKRGSSSSSRRASGIASRSSGRTVASPTSSKMPSRY